MSKAKTIQRIAREILELETLDLRNRDALDFQEVYVGSIRRALEAAYTEGARQPKLRGLIKASDDLTSAIELAAVLFETGLLDKIQPAQGRLMDATSAAEKILKRGPP